MVINAEIFEASHISMAAWLRLSPAVTSAQVSRQLGFRVDLG